jgi:hypothetical protein
MACSLAGRHGIVHWNGFDGRTQHEVHHHRGDQLLDQQDQGLGANAAGGHLVGEPLTESGTLAGGEVLEQAPQVGIAGAGQRFSEHRRQHPGLSDDGFGQLPVDPIHGLAQIGARVRGHLHAQEREVAFEDGEQEFVAAAEGDVQARHGASGRRGDRFQGECGQPVFADQVRAGLDRAFAYRALSTGVHAGRTYGRVQGGAGTADAAQQGASGDAGLLGDRLDGNVGDVLAQPFCRAQGGLDQVDGDVAVRHLIAPCVRYLDGVTCH